MRSRRADTFARLRGIPLRRLNIVVYSAWVFGHPPRKVQRKIFCMQAEQADPLEHLCASVPAIWNPNQPSSPAILQRL